LFLPLLWLSLRKRKVVTTTTIIIITIIITIIRTRSVVASPLSTMRSWAIASGSAERKSVDMKMKAKGRNMEEVVWPFVLYLKLER